MLIVVVGKVLFFSLIIMVFVNFSYSEEISYSRPINFDGKFIGYNLDYVFTTDFEQFKQYIDILSSHQINYTRLWLVSPPQDWFPYKIVANGKYDLTQFNDKLFRLIKQAILYANSKGIIVSLAIFDRCGLKKGKDRWERHPWNAKNNLNGFIKDSRDGLPDFFKPEYIEYHYSLVDRVMAEFGDLQGVIFEVMNEGSGGYNWESKIIKRLRDKEARYILSSARKDTKKIIPLVDFYSPHNITSPEDVKKCKFKGEKIIYDNDGWTRCKDVYGTAVEALKQGRGFALLELKPLDPELINYANLEALERAILAIE